MNKLDTTQLAKQSICQRSIDTLKMLGVEMIEQANSGHPGIVLGAAPLVYSLWEHFLSFNPREPRWFNRDRFVLSAGHGSALLYALLYMNGFDLTIDDLKAFRQLDSKTPGHPEYGHTPGVDATTGPLSQGLGMAVGMAMAEKHLAAVYNRPTFPVIDHFTYALVGDGDLEEGLSQEAINLAGHLALRKLIVLYDSNDISLDGPLSDSSSENAAQRFRAAGWDYQLVNNGNDIESLDTAIAHAQRSDKPSLIEVKTIIGEGTPLAGTNKVHGAPLGHDNLVQLKKSLDWQLAPFQVDEDVYNHYDHFINQKISAYHDWQKLFHTYQEQFPKLAVSLLDNQLRLPSKSVVFKASEMIATRNASSTIMQALATTNPNFWGGAADLTASNKTYLIGCGDFTATHPQGRNIHYGIREFGMAAAANGITLHGGSRTFVSTFLVFSDYLKAAIRLAALMKVPTTYVFSHDSIAVGEDGPTHEPVEQITGLRAIPGINVFRPADANETLASWQTIGQITDQPAVLVTSRQKLPVMAETANSQEKVARGGYVISPAKVTAEGLLIASGSEVSLAIQAQQALRQMNHDVAVVSMPCLELFNRQPNEYRQKVLPPTVTKRVAIEMGTGFIWNQYVGTGGKIISVDCFGQSGDGPTIAANYGFTVDNVVNTYLSLNS